MFIFSCTYRLEGQCLNHVEKCKYFSLGSVVQETEGTVEDVSV